MNQYGETFEWDETNIRRLLACDNDDLMTEFPGQSIANLRNRRSLFRRGRPELMPGNDDLVKPLPLRPHPQRQNWAATPPRGWEPRVVYGKAGPEQIYSPPLPHGLDEDEALRATLEVLAAMVPEGYVARLAEVRLDNGAWHRTPEQAKEGGAAWTAPTRRYRWVVEPVRVNAGADLDELRELRSRILDLKPLSGLKTVPNGASTFVVALSDWQMGKGENGGSAGTVARIQTAIDAAVRRLTELDARGTAIERVALVGLGDLVEGCSGFYPMQEFQTDLTRREQVNITRRLILRTIRAFAETGLPITVAGVGGNHGENRKDGKAYTTFGDNDDVSVFEQVQDVISSADTGQFGAVEFVLPRDELSLCLEVSGTRVGIVHGHQFGGGATPGAKALAWWKSQSLGEQSVGAAQILLSGHLHHFDLNPFGNRTHFQAPAIDGGSQWFTERSGIVSPPGLLTMLIGAACGPLGWAELALL